jgi:hypothetical protein
LENNGWYYISPRLTFQCLEEMVNHYCGESKTETDTLKITSSIFKYISFYQTLATFRCALAKSTHLEQERKGWVCC